MSIVVALALLVIAGANVIAQLVAFRRYSLNTPVFMALVEKLMYLNNIDRAIKLCYAEPNALTSRVIRALLITANRVEQLDLVHEEQIVMLDEHERRVRRVTRNERILELLIIVGFVFAGIVADDRAVAEAAILTTIVAGFVMLVGAFLRSVNVRHARAARGAALTVRNMLYRRAQYVPPQYRPCEMALTEVAAWRERHVAFEAAVAALRTQGDERPAHEIHAERVDDLGVLKPL